MTLLFAKDTKIAISLLSCLLFCYPVFPQVYDILALESFDNTAGLTTDTGFGNEDKSCTTSDMFDVSATHTDPADITNSVGFEDGSVFCGSDINGISGVATPSYLEIFNYTADHMDNISFVGRFAFAVSCGGGQDYNASDNLVVQYSTDGGTIWTTGLTLTGAGVGSSFSNSDGDFFASSDGSANVQGNLLDKEFSIGTGLSGQVIKIKVLVNGFTSSGEAFFLDEFRLVRTRTSLLCENFDNTASLTSSSGAVFQTPIESATCSNNAIYDVTANMGTPANATNCIDAEDGSFFIMTRRGSVPGVVDGEELELLTYTAISNNHISFRGNFASFGDDQNSDNFIVVSYSTDNGATFTDALTFAGVDGPTKLHTSSDGTPDFGNYFLTKGFPIGSGLMGQTIKIKVTFNSYTNGGDGIALDKFCLDESVDPMVLPVTMVNFTAKPINKTVAINWATASEINNSHFEVQKSTDAENWQILSILKGSENGNNLSQYRLTDEYPFNNLNYYRLKQVDFDGNFTFSKVAVVNFNLSNIQLFPSILEQAETYNLNGVVENTSVMIYSAYGQLVESMVLVNENNAIQANYPKGVYLIHINENGIKTNKKLVIR